MISPDRQKQGHALAFTGKLTEQSHGGSKSIIGLGNGASVTAGRKVVALVGPREVRGGGQVVKSLEDQAQVVALGIGQLRKPCSQQRARGLVTARKATE